MSEYKGSSGFLALGVILNLIVGRAIVTTIEQSFSAEFIFGDDFYLFVDRTMRESFAQFIFAGTTQGTLIIPFIKYSFLSIILAIACIVYAIKIYPGYFDILTRFNKEDSSYSIKYYVYSKIKENSSRTSFLNGFFGGIIFGPIWQVNLRKAKRGISYIVYITIIIIVWVLSYFLFCLDLYDLIIMYL